MPRKHEDVEFHCQNHIKKLGGAVQAVIPASGRQRQEKLWDLLASQPG